MDLKKLAVAVVVGYLVLMVLGYLIHSLWLMPVYRQYAGAWRPADIMMKKRWVMFVGEFIFTVLFAWIYTRGRENKPWVAQGIRYGILMTLLAVVPAACSEYTIYPIPYTLALKWMVGGGVQLIALGLVVAGFCRKPAR
jgi:hypothetical protein